MSMNFDPKLTGLDRAFQAQALVRECDRLLLEDDDLDGRNALLVLVPVEFRNGREVIPHVGANVCSR